MKPVKNKKQIAPLPYPFYFVPVLLVSLIGLIDSIYLSISHYRIYTDIGYKSFCAISGSINCDTVSLSPYSLFMGIPVPVWGIIGYIVFLWLLFYALPQGHSRKKIWTWLFLLAFIFSACSILLSLISLYVIHSYCIMCIVSYAVNLLLLYLTWIIRRRFKCEPVFKALIIDKKYLVPHIVPGFLIFISCTLLLILFFPPYWKISYPELSKNIATGVTPDGHPWIGSENPEMEIIEFSDYRCFQCKKMHYYLRFLVQEKDRKIRLIHRHFPMDHAINPIVKRPFHQGAAKLALVSIVSMQKGKFWEMNDALFSISRQTELINLKKIAELSGINYNDIKNVFHNNEAMDILKKDILAALKFGLTGTPGFVIDGNVYTGRIPPEIFN